MAGKIATLLALGTLLVLSALNEAKSHEFYDPWCCSGQDCAPAQVEHLPDGSIRATTKYGTAVFPPSIRRRPSPDGRYHACIPPWAKTPEGKARCIYAPAGV